MQLGSEDKRVAEVAARLAALDNRSLPLLAVGDHSGVVFARRHALTARQSGHVHDYVRLQVLLGVGDTVAQDQATLGVSVGDLNSPLGGIEVNF